MMGDGVLKHFVCWYNMPICEIPAYIYVLFGKYKISKLREEADTSPNTLLPLSHILRIIDDDLQ